MAVIRLGILSTAKIASVIAEAANHLSEVRVIAVASRTSAKAELFATLHDVPHTCTYEEMLSDDDIDAVYIPLPTALAIEWTLRAIAAGKHVLVEKPFASLSALEVIINAAQEAGVMFMDGTHFVHAKRTQRMKATAQTMLGELRNVTAHFSSPHRFSTDIRTDATLEPLGAVGDLGWYCVRAAVVFLGVDCTSALRQVTCIGTERSCAPGVINEASGVVEFVGGEKLSIDCSFETAMRMRVEVAGTKGCIRVNDFVTPFPQWDRPGTPPSMKIETTFETEIGTWATGGYPGLSVSETITVDEGNYGIQTARMLREFSRMIQEKDEAAAKQWGLETINTQRIVDALHRECMRNIGEE